MAAKDLLTFAFVLIFVSCCVHGFPNSGINECNIMFKNKSCDPITHAMYRGGLVFLEITLHENQKGTLEYSVYKQCPIGAKTGLCSSSINFKGEKDSVWTITRTMDNCKLSPNLSVAEQRHGIFEGAVGVENVDPSQAVIDFVEDGLYVVEVYATNLETKSERRKRDDDEYVDNSTKLQVRVIMKNPRGYLDAVDYPYLVFYSLMFVGYFFLGIIWSICMCCSCKDLIRLQLFIGVAILLGFAEKLFFVAEYGYVNNTGSRYADFIIPLLIIAEFISAGKKTFARVLLIIISSGLGYNKLNTVNTSTPSKKPSLAFLLMLFVFGAVFFTAAVADGFVRACYYTPLEGFNNATVITAIILVILDTICIFWIVTSLIRTRRTLKENNDHRLNTYNHFCCTLVVISVGILSFFMWIFITGFLDSCSQDWRGLWLKECFWPLLFTLLLVIIMILWRPSSKPYTGKVVYTAVPQGETKEMAMKDNFETMRMRHGSKSEGLPLNSDSEEDVIFFQ